MLLAAPLLVAMLGVPARLGAMQPATLLLLGLWWAGQGVYLVALGLVLVGRLR